MKKVASLCLYLVWGLFILNTLVGCIQQEEKEKALVEEAAKGIPSKTVECYQCDHKECELNKFDSTLAWYECPKCGAEMTYHKKENKYRDVVKWVLYSFDRGDKLEQKKGCIHYGEGHDCYCTKEGCQCCEGSIKCHPKCRCYKEGSR